MKTEKQIRAKLKKVIKAHDKCLVTPSDSTVYDYTLGMVDILEWVLEDETR